MGDSLSEETEKTNSLELIYLACSASDTNRRNSSGMSIGTTEASVGIYHWVVESAPTKSIMDSLP